MPAGQSGPFTADPLTPDRIQDLLADGFEIRLTATDEVNVALDLVRRVAGGIPVTPGI